MDWIGLDWIRWHDCDPVFYLVIVAAELVLFFSNYVLGLGYPGYTTVKSRH